MSEASHSPEPEPSAELALENLQRLIAEHGPEAGMHDALKILRSVRRNIGIASSAPVPQRGLLQNAERLDEVIDYLTQLEQEAGVERAARRVATADVLGTTATQLAGVTPEK